MKYNTLASMHIFITLAVLTSALHAAASDSGAVHITGTVDEVVEFVIQPTANALSLELKENFEMAIAQIMYATNAKDGFKIKVNSLYDFALKGQGENGQDAAYKLKFGHNPTEHNSQNAELLSVSSQSTTTDNVNEQLHMVFDEQDLLWEPEFIDTITITIEAN